MPPGSGIGVGVDVGDGVGDGIGVGVELGVGVGIGICSRYGLTTNQYLRARTGQTPATYIPLVSGLLLSAVFVIVAIWRFKRTEF
jgi:hypothetical protein